MKKSLLFLAGFSAVALSVQADRIREGYINWPESGSLPEYVQQWNGGSGTLTVKGEAWEDENFFISRVKPKTRFYNNASQVNPSLTQYDATTNPDAMDKRYVWWVPIGDCTDGQPHTNALPNGLYDSEVFSMWSYMDHYGNWTSPWGWAPGAFADVAHKNGVAVSGVASVPFGGISDGWAKAFGDFKNVDGTDVAKFLYYHGVDGLGYNSEWSGTAPSTYITPNHDKIAAYMESRNPIYENMWYGGTNDNGSIQFDSGVHSGYRNIFKNASMFLNYNWNSASTMSSSIAYAKEQGRNPFYIYAGMNQQGGEPKSGENYPLLAKYQYSIGVWGAHNYNMFWQGRTNEGAALATVQRCYLNMCERWFSNGKRNPAIKMDITTNRAHAARENFAGMSSMMTARSTLSWDLKTEPFISYLNLGNGTFFNWHGERVSNDQWYNIGIQDYLPTWRWWFAPTFMQHEVTEGTTHMAADFVWDDAYFGGSCLQVAGTTQEEYLHLFKTEFKVAANYVLRVRYKVMEGKGDVALVASTKGSESTIAAMTESAGNTNVLCTTENSEALRRLSMNDGAEGWQTIEYKFKSKECATGAFKNPIAVLGLQIKNAENLKLYIGEVSLVSNAKTTTPEAPQIKKTKVLYCDMNGVDGKVIWNMPNTKSVGEPVYNSDVKASMYKVYAQEEDGEAQFLGATTSWAAIAFRAPNTDDSKKLRFGVSAVGIDMTSESAITWGDYQSKGEYTQTNDVALSKTTIKPNESFDVHYVDPRHAASNFKIYNSEGTLVAQATGTAIEVTEGLPAVGGYDLVIDEGTSKERRFAYYVQISGEEVGAVPEIYSLVRDNETVTDNQSVSIELTDTPTLAYTGRDADGLASRSIGLNNGHIGCSNTQLGFQAQSSFTLAGWFRFNDFPEKGWAFLNITNKENAWPNCNWGWCWGSVSKEGALQLTFRGNQSDQGSPGELIYTFPDTKFQANIWTHYAMVCEFGSQGFRFRLYVNGVLQKSNWEEWKYWHHEAVTQSGHENDFCANRNFPLAYNDDIIFGGVQYQESAAEGCVDNFQIWNKALTADEVKISMGDIDRDNIPSGLVAFADFEDDCDPETSKFKSLGENKNVDIYNFDLYSNPNGGEGNMLKLAKQPAYNSGCPFIIGTAYPVVTAPTWDVSDRMAEVNKVQARAGANEGVAGAATVKFSKAGDHTVALTLANSYGSDTREYPVFSVQENAAIGDVVNDGNEVAAYTVDDVLFVEFAQDGNYNVEVYNMAGMQVGNANLKAVAGQNARITLGAAGVYLVRVSLDGKELRTIKVIRK